MLCCCVGSSLLHTYVPLTHILSLSLCVCVCVRVGCVLERARSAVCVCVCVCCVPERGTHGAGGVFCVVYLILSKPGSQSAWLGL